MIPRLAADQCDQFIGEYYHAEQPVVLTGATNTPATADEVCQKLNSRINEDKSVTQRLLWYDVRRDLLDEICTTPAIVDRMMDPDEAFLRDNCVRIWFNPGGHITPWHYDGHSLNVFNLQLKGKKRWTVVAPETPMWCTPFSHTAALRHPSLKGKKVFEFDVDEGDMLFLPRYWFHYVESVDPMNINVNWVLMPKVEAVASTTGKREAEMMWLKTRLNPILPANARKTLATYAGHGKPAVDLLTENVSASAGLTRFAKELLGVPLWAVALPTHLMKLRALVRTKRMLKALRDKGQSAKPSDRTHAANY